MAQTLSVVMKVEGVASELVTTKGHKAQVAALYKLFNSLLSGGKHANIDVYSSTSAPVAASGTVTVGAPNATDTLVVGGVTFTGDDTPEGAQFDTSGTAAEAATSLAAAINAHATLSKIVEAVADDDEVTITCLQKGVVGNFITLAETGSSLTLSGAALAGGTGGIEGEAQNYSVGI